VVDVAVTKLLPPPSLPFGRKYLSLSLLSSTQIMQ